MTKNNVISFSESKGVAQSNRRLIPSRLKDARLVKRLSQVELAENIGVSRAAVSAYEQGEKSPSSDVLMRIVEKLEQPLSFFVTEDMPLFGASSVRFYRSFGAATNRRNSMSDILSNWFVQTARYYDAYVNFPDVSIPVCEASSPDGRYTAEEIEAVAEECRKLWNLGYGPISNVISLLENKGIITCRYEMTDEKIEAFSFWNGNRAFIFLASDKKSSVRARFDAAHELGHLILHRWVDQEDIENKKLLKTIESEANRFAGAFLLPRKSFPSEVYTTRLDAFIELKRRWKSAIQAMVFRCKQLGVFDEDQITNLYKQISSRKWRTNEPLDDVFELEQPKLIKQAVELLIKSGKKTASDICNEMRVNQSTIEKLCNLPENFLSTRTSIEEFTPTLK